MAENDEEKLLAVARHIAKTLGQNDSAADDILQIFSNFDVRFSRHKLSENEDRLGRGRSALDRTLNSLDRRIILYATADQPIWAPGSDDSSDFLDAIDELIRTIREWSPMAASDKSLGACLVRAEDMMQHAMLRVEAEFKSLLERGAESFDQLDPQTIMTIHESDEELGTLQNADIPVARPVTDYNVVIDALPSRTINDLHEIAKRMAAAGYGKECTLVYSQCRREFLEESLLRLGFQKLSFEEVHRMPWQELEDEIERWTKVANFTLRVLFPSERRLCDRVFLEFPSAGAELPFVGIFRGPTLQLLDFAHSIAILSRSPERLFKVLQLFETLRDLMPEFGHVFSSSDSLLGNEAVIVWKSLGEAIRGMLMELENLIHRDPAKEAVPGGGLHPMTCYVMNYLGATCASRSRHTLEQVFDEISNNNLDDDDDDDEDDDDHSESFSSSISDQISRIVNLLETNLEEKSKIYNDTSLSAVFMMNNVRYIVQKVKGSDLGPHLGDDWIRKHNAKVRQYYSIYLRSSWNNVLGTIKFDEDSRTANTFESMMARIKCFNSQFEELCKTQSTWVISDEQLREELRISVSRILLQAYTLFTYRFKRVSGIRRNAEKLVKEDYIEPSINMLFCGRKLESKRILLASSE